MANTGKEKYFGDVCIRTSVIPYLEEIADLLSIAFGPMGDAVMIHQKSPKEVKLTKVNETLETAFLTNHKNVIINHVNILDIERIILYFSFTSVDWKYSIRSKVLVIL